MKNLETIKDLAQDSITFFKTLPDFKRYLEAKKRMANWERVIEKYDDYGHHVLSAPSEYINDSLEVRLYKCNFKILFH